MESFFDKFVDYLFVTLLEMESRLTILLQVFLKAANIFLYIRQLDSFMLLILFLLIDLLTSLQESRWYFVKVPGQYDKKYTNH